MNQFRKKHLCQKALSQGFHFTLDFEGPHIKMHLYDFFCKIILVSRLNDLYYLAVNMNTATLDVSYVQL